MTCPHCGGELAKKARRAVSPMTVDTASMTERELFTWYRKTAPVEDARFYLRVCNGSLSPMARAELAAVVAEQPARAEAARRVRAVMDAARAYAGPRARCLRDAGFGIWVRGGTECSGYGMAGRDRPTAAQEQDQVVLT